VERFTVGDYGTRVDVARDDEIGRLAGAFNDMAAMIEAQLAALRETDRQRRQLVADVTHDFRTPLTSLRGHAEQLLGGLGATSEDARQRLQAILDNADRLTRLAAQLAVLARLDAYEQTLQLETFSMAELVQDVAVKFHPDAERRGVTLDCHCAEALPAARADLGLIDRLLSNLIDNALRATAAGGRVSVTATAITTDGGTGIAVDVEDSGRGIPAEELALVTQRFYRVRSDVAGGQEGSGLGLSIVREILERHGTRLHLDSRVGVGTRARFILPGVTIS